MNGALSLVNITIENTKTRTRVVHINSTSILMVLGPVPLHMISPDNFGGTNYTKIWLIQGMACKRLQV